MRRVLAEALADYARTKVTVLAWCAVAYRSPPGSRPLDAPLDALVYAKLGCPGRRRWPSARSTRRGRVLNPQVADQLEPSEIAEVTDREAPELARGRPGTG